jgi:hypothetical protein
MHSASTIQVRPSDDKVGLLFAAGGAMRATTPEEKRSAAYLEIPARQEGLLRLPIPGRRLTARM